METIKESELEVSINGLEPSTRSMLQEAFAPFVDQMNEWATKAESLQVTSIEQKDEMKMARVARLALRSIRTEADKKRKELKADALKYGNAVQSVYNLIESKIKPIEDHLLNQEEFEKRRIEAEKAKLKADRELEVAPYVEFIPSFIDFGEMSEEDYSKLLSGAKLQMDAKIKAEAERREKEAEEARKRELFTARRNEASTLFDYIPNFMGVNWGELTDDEYASIINDAKAAKDKKMAELEAQRLENERLKKEAEERERAEAEAIRKREIEAAKEREKAEAERKEIEEKARKEKEAYEAELKKERERQAKIEAELKAKKDAEETERKAKEAEARKLKRAGDSKKLHYFIDLIEKAVADQDSSLLEFKSDEIVAISDKLVADIAHSIKYAREALFNL